MALVTTCPHIPESLGSTTPTPFLANCSGGVGLMNGTSDLVDVDLPRVGGRGSCRLLVFT